MHNNFKILGENKPKTFLKYKRGGTVLHCRFNGFLLASAAVISV